MKLTKQLALQLANLLDLSALAPDEDLDRHAVREIAESLFEGRLNSFQFDLLTDWTHKIAAARLGWRRGRLTGQIAGPVAASIGGSEVHHVYFAPNAPRTPFRFSFSAAPTANS